MSDFYERMYRGYWQPNFDGYDHASEHRVRPSTQAIACDDSVGGAWRMVADRVSLAQFPAPVNVRIYEWEGKLAIILAMKVSDRATGDPIDLHHETRIHGPPGIGALVDAIRHGMIDMLRHEVDECLRVDGKIVFDPHANGGDIIGGPNAGHDEVCNRSDRGWGEGLRDAVRC